MKLSEESGTNELTPAISNLKPGFTSTTITKSYRELGVSQTNQ